ncbi:MAG: DnaJ domain-containing protein [Chloroflexota bacterium]|nr:DnaJ domain-containing protein [Chloroflexota bacterium]
MPPDRDPYYVLGIDETASDAEVRAAYRRAARSNHPDLNPHDPLAAARMRIVQQAYEILADPARRAAYRRPGSGAATSPDAGPAVATQLDRGDSRRRTDLSPEVAEVFIALGVLARRAKVQKRFRQLIRYLEQL